MVAVPTISKIFKYNREFSYPPNNTTNAAWGNLFPKDGGFFTHPPAVSERSTFSVFHQLHCLDAIRHGYWQLHDAATEGRKISDGEFPMHTSPSHIRHCTDLLRQSLMCAADRTIEVKDDQGGVSGFGTLHQCADYDDLLDTVGKWQHAVR
ncbi:hypothetical protein DM02DRAFT_534913 [Periconia macrospinosa]|uniref:Oxidase ustYa n=1 Tax=Periconia macrospinosa TaxID=97972 RepID=A0A2V1DEW0_9PLEO|nr:hypothetical protein DM02DRAFT_534913 [Periconia macrospinosa]